MGLFSNYKPVNRFDNYDPTIELNKQRLCGIINNETDFELGTASLGRHENITLVSSSANQENLLVELKWRSFDSSRLVHLSSRLCIELDGQTYEHKQELTYECEFSKIHPGRILQYGCPKSNLKLFVAAPYRRMRIQFRGYMRSSLEETGDKFVVANLVVCPASGLFDFLHEIDTEKSMKPLLRAHDRHEQLVTILSEIDIKQNESEIIKKTLFTSGFHSRYFLDKHNPSTRELRRIFIMMPHGHVLNLCKLDQLDQSNSKSFGYYARGGEVGLTKVEDESIHLNWSDLDKSNFDIEVETHVKTFSLKCCKSSRLNSSIFDLTTKTGEPHGWAYVSINQELSSQESLESIRSKLNIHREDISKGIIGSLIPMEISSSQRPLVLSVADPLCLSAQLVGSKASSLAKLRSRSILESEGGAGYEVPYAFVLTRFAFDAFMDYNSQLKLEADKLDEYLSGTDLSELKTKCDYLQKLFEKATLPVGLREELSTCLEAQYGTLNSDNGRLFAVRSSSWGEDEDDMSAAGQLKTVLGVKGFSDILVAINACFASKFNLSNVHYKRQHGLSPSLPMAVVIQELVGCNQAGVLFSCDPRSGDTTRMLITANYGLGETVVSGQCEPDSIHVRISQEGTSDESHVSIESINVGKKGVVIDANTLQGNPANQYDYGSCCISDEAILRLARCSLLIANYFQSPRDIEWGFCDGRLYIFQSRPVTGLDNYTEFELLHELDLWSRDNKSIATRANVGEVFSSAVTPLTATQMIKSWTLFGHRNERKSILIPKRRYYCETNDTFMSSRYHIFLQLSSRRTSVLFGLDKHGKKFPLTLAYELSMFGHELDDADLKDAVLENYKNGPSYKMIIAFIRLSLLPIRLRSAKHYKKILKQSQKFRKRICDFSQLEGDKMAILYDRLLSCWEVGLAALTIHGCNLIASIDYNSQLIEFLSKFIKDKMKLHSIMAKFLAISPKVISAEIPERIESMAQVIRSKEAGELEKFIKMAPAEALDYMRKDPVLAKKLDSFLDKFGHRSYLEFEIMNKSWREDVELLSEMVRMSCTSTGNRKKEMTSVDQIIESIEPKLGRKDKWLLKNIYVKDCQRVVSSREMTKHCLIYTTDTARIVARQLGAEMRRQLRIPDEELLYFIMNDEMEPLIREPQPGIVMQALRRKQMFKKNFKEPWIFDELVKDPNATPKHLKQDAQLDPELVKAQKLYGTPASSGKIQSRVCLCTKYSELNKVRDGDIMIAHSTDVGFSPVFPLISGIVTEVGGIVSHGAVIAREYGLPSLLGVPDVTSILKDGEEIILDADNGVIIRLGQQES